MSLNKITYEYKKCRKDFGRSTRHFTKSNIGELININRDEKLLSYFQRSISPKEKSTNFDKEYSAHSVNTQHKIHEDKGMLHLEGGWPKDISTESIDIQIEHIDQKKRYRKRVEKRDDYKEELKKAVNNSVKILRLNNTLRFHDMYFEECEEIKVIQEIEVENDKEEDKEKETEENEKKNIKLVSGEKQKEKKMCNEMNYVMVSKEIKEKHRKICNCSWNKNGDRLCISYNNKSTGTIGDGDNNKSYIWNIENSITPENEIIPVNVLSYVTYNPNDNNFIIGGNENGFIEIFDVRKGKRGVQSVKISHDEKVNCIKFLNEEYECCSVANDSRLFYWDIRNFDKPICMFGLEENGKKLTGIDINFDSDFSVFKLLVSTKEGYILKVKKLKENKVLVENTFFNESESPVFSIERNYFFKKFFLSVSDWSVKIWNDDFKSPLNETKYEDNYVLNGKWSKKYPSVCYTSNYQGIFEIWDLATSQAAPFFTNKVSSFPLKKIYPLNDSNTFAVSDDNGACYILDVKIDESTLTELNFFQSFLEREYKRENNLTKCFIK